MVNKAISAENTGVDINVSGPSGLIMLVELSMYPKLQPMSV